MEREVEREAPPSPTRFVRPASASVQPQAKAGKLPSSKGIASFTMEDAEEEVCTYIVLTQDTTFANNAQISSMHNAVPFMPFQLVSDIFRSQEAPKKGKGKAASSAKDSKSKNNKKTAGMQSMTSFFGKK